MESGALGSAGDSTGNTAASVMASDYGYSDDGEWHHLEIPLQVFADGGVDLSEVLIPLRLGGMGGESGERLLVDNLYLEP